MFVINVFRFGDDLFGDDLIGERDDDKLKLGLCTFGVLLLFDELVIREELERQDKFGFGLFSRLL